MKKIALPKKYRLLFLPLMLLATSISHAQTDCYTSFIKQVDALEKDNKPGDALNRLIKLEESCDVTPEQQSTINERKKAIQRKIDEASLLKDTDGDGFPDNKDKCPNQFSKTNGGCPPRPVPTAPAKFSLFDGFDNNKNNWLLVDNENIRSVIKNGVLEITTDTKYGTSGFKKFDINLSKDFTYSIEAKAIDTTDNRDYGIVFAKGNDSAYYFTITQKGQYYLRAGRGNVYNITSGNSKDINLGRGTNVFKIEKIQDHLTLYINDKKQATVPFARGYGPYFGVSVNADQKLQFDNFVLTGTHKTPIGYLDLTETGKYVFVDYLHDNLNKWPLQDIAKPDYMQISGLEMEPAEDSGLVSIKKGFPIDITKDFVCEVLTGKSHATNDKGFGIYFCGNAAGSSFYSFFVSDKGYYEVIKDENGALTPIVPRSKSSAIKISNIIRIEKEGMKMSFYANGELLSTIPAPDGFGKSFGFCVQGKQNVYFRDFLLSGKR